MSILHVNKLNKRDFFVALAVALVGLAVYVRVLAPDVLYSDSGEFQTLAYTWGTTYTTGYPVYLVLARVVGFIPIGTLAWRINLASALFAAITLGVVYLITRRLTHWGGALLASLVLLLSYTFWSQSIIAEVYTLATALISIALLVLLLWHEQPLKRRWLLLVLGFLLGAGLGVHLFMLLIAPAIFLFVLWGILFGAAGERRQWQHLLRLILGGVAGLALFYLLFVAIDTRPTPTNIFATSIIPSRDAWGLQATDLDSEPERFWISVSGYQWRDRMAPSDVDYGEALTSFFNDDLAREYAVPTTILAGLGVLAVLVVSRRLFMLLGVALLTAFAAGFLYFPGDKFIFYLPFYLLLAILSGIGAGSLIALVLRLIPSSIPVPRVIPALIVSVILIALCAAPFGKSCWLSIQRGYSGFITEDYVYPVTHPNAARAAAECAVSKIAEPEAFLVLDWRALYSIYYVAHVEQGRTGLIIREAQPYPSQVITPTLSAEIDARIRSGEAVYVDDMYTPIKNLYTATPVSGSCSTYRLFKLSLRG